MIIFKIVCRLQQPAMLELPLKESNVSCMWTTPSEQAECLYHRHRHRQYCNNEYSHLQFLKALSRNENLLQTRSCFWSSCHDSSPYIKVRRRKNLQSHASIRVVVKFYKMTRGLPVRHSAAEELQFLSNDAQALRVWI